MRALTPICLILTLLFFDPMARRFRILLLIPHLGGGGAEQVTALLARGLSREKYELHLGLITPSPAGSEPPPPWVAVHSLGAPRVRSAAFRLLRLVRRLKPDLVLSGMAHLNFLVLLLRPFFPLQTRVLVRQNSTVSSDLAPAGLPLYTRLLYRMLYRRADRIICQSSSMADDLALQLGISRRQIAVLPNPLDLDAIHAAAANPAPWTGPGPHLLAVGRLVPEKGFDLLLHALSSLRASYPHADLVIAGAGPEETTLKALCRALALDAAVRFPGHLRRPWALLPGATLFVLSSRSDAMPNALLEAAAAGLPLVALPASGGVADLLRNHPGVWLAPETSAAALAAALLAALQSLRPDQRFIHSFLTGSPQPTPPSDREK